jgi:hypothetical protein
VLEDKASFFEGQLNPLHYENQLLKEQIIAMNRMITRTTGQLYSQDRLIEEAAHPHIA